MVQFVPRGLRTPLYRNPPVNTPSAVADRVRQIIAARGLTLYQVSQQSAEIFGRSSPYYVPQDFYSLVAGGKAGPSIQQFIACSRISRYRLSDWLTIFAFSPDNIPRLQTLFPRRRTILLDTSVYDESRWIPWFEARTANAPPSAITPLAQLLKPARPRRAETLLARNTRSFLYAQIGRDDIFASPDLTAGSIARIDPESAAHLPSGLAPAPSNRVFLLGTSSGLTCGHLRRIAGNHVALCSTAFSCPQRELTLGRGASILGVVDAEIRPMASGQHAAVLEKQRTRAVIPNPPLREPAAKLGQLLRAGRLRAGLSFREASAMSCSLANRLSDITYFASPGTLSDYERLSSPPRHIQKILSLSILYGIGFWDFLRAGDVTLDSLGDLPMPDTLSGRRGAPNVAEDPPEPSPGSAERRDFLSALLAQWCELPLFLHHSLGEITGLPHLSLLDFFWAGNGTLLVINRRLKKPLKCSGTMPREQPAYVLVKRDGSYLAGCCASDRGKLAVHRHPLLPLLPVESEGRVDAEIIGQVTAIVRPLP